MMAACHRFDAGSSVILFRFAAVQQGHSEAGDPLGPSQRTELLGAAALHGNRAHRCIAQQSFHLLSVGRQAGRLADHRTVDVANQPPRLVGPLCGQSQQHDRVGAAPRRVSIGKHLADITKSSGAQDCIGYRVGNGIGIAVAFQATMVGEVHAAQHQPAIGIVRKLVHVEALPDAHGHTGHCSANR